MWRYHSPRKTQYPKNRIILKCLRRLDSFGMLLTQDHLTKSVALCSKAWNGEFVGAKKAK